MSYRNLLIETKDAVAIVTVNRPDKLNALNDRTMEELDAGFAGGGGCELAMACHLRIASENARLGTPEVKLGIMCGYAGTQRLLRLVGKGRALEMLLTGEMVAAAEALRIGLVNRVVARDKLLAEAEA